MHPMKKQGKRGIPVQEKSKFKGSCCCVSTKPGCLNKAAADGGRQRPLGSSKGQGVPRTPLPLLSILWGGQGKDEHKWGCIYKMLLRRTMLSQKVPAP